LNLRKNDKYENDPRITKIGSFLRKTSLDELPQIFNVLKGEMSLIGPRPYMPNEHSKMGDNIDIILAVKPGITGLWQVSGRNEVEFASRVNLDVWYVRNWSVWSDIVILIKTVQVVLGRKGVS
jgi:undecaprenyl-phosphate galactose phosphotransferase